MKAPEKGTQHYGSLSFGWRVSLVLHVIVLLLVIFGLPAFFEAQRDMEPVTISVEILPITGKTNIKPSAREVAPDVQEVKEQPKPVQEASKTVTPPKPTPPTPTPTPPPPPKEVVSPDAPKEKKEPEKPKDEPKPQPKKEEKKPEKKKPDESLDDIMKKVADAAKSSPQTQPNPKPAPKQTAPVADTSNKPNNSTQYDASQPMSMSELDAIKSQIAKCWNMPAGAKDAQNLIVRLKLQYNPDGTLSARPTLASDQGRYASDGFFRAAADSAIRAAQQCSPLVGLPADKYNTWKEIDMGFNPSEM